MIPSAFKQTCEFCKREIDTRAEGTHQWTKGWVKMRSGGGGHGISVKETEPRWACDYCVKRKSQGYLDQGKMF